MCEKLSKNGERNSVKTNEQNDKVKGYRET